MWVLSAPIWTHLSLETFFLLSPSVLSAWAMPMVGPRKGLAQDTHLVDEGRELAVEALDLFLLLMLHALSIGVDLQVEGREQALIDSGDTQGV